MKRTLALLLVFAMLFCMVPAFSPVIAAEDGGEPQLGLNAEFYQLEGIADTADVYRDIIGTDSGEGHRDSFEDTQRYTQSIEQLLKVSKENGKAEGLTGFTPYDAGASGDGYLIKWTGTITAAEAGTYYFVGHKIDNGFVAIVNGKRVYEYWAAYHWFDNNGIDLYSNLGGFTLEADKATPVEFWYLETNGGEALEMGISKSPDSGAMSFQDAGVTFALDAVRYNTNLKIDHETIWRLLSDGVCIEGAEDGNGASAQESGNHLYESTIAGLKNVMIPIGKTVVPSFESEAFNYGRQFGWRWDDCLIEYTGYVTPTKGGTYEFGTSKVDNCLFVEITDPDTGKTATAYEFWASRVWNDKGDTYYGQTIDLEAGKAYEIHAVFLEIDGGQAISTIYKIDGDRFDFKGSGLVFTTTKPTSPVTSTNLDFFAKGAEWYYMTSGEENDQAPAAGWMTDASVYGEWDTANADLGEKGSDAWGTDDAASCNQSIWAVKEFTVEDLDAIANWALMTEMFFDDNIHIYINGTPVFIHSTWNDGYLTYKLAEKASSVLKKGKNVIAASLVQGHGGYAFDMSLYATKSDTSGYKPAVTVISNADQLLSFVETVNNDNEKGKGQVFCLSADIDMTGKTWTPIKRFIGTLDGNGYKIKNLTYTASVDVSDGNQYVGMFVEDLSNNNANGMIANLTFENCSFKVNATGSGSVYAGMVAGSLDRGTLRNVTVKSCTLENSGYAAGGFAGRACWAVSAGHIVDCTIENSRFKASGLAAGLAAFAEGGDEVILTGNEIINSTLEAENTTPAVGEVNCNVNTEGLTVRSSLTLESGKDYMGFYQTRPNAEDSTLTDYRVVVIAKTDWIQANYAKGFKVTFSDGTTTKSFDSMPTTVFKNVSAATDSYVDIYEAVGDTVVFGWVVTEVPAGFTPSVEIGG